MGSGGHRGQRLAAGQNLRERLREPVLGAHAQQRGRHALAALLRAGQQERFEPSHGPLRAAARQAVSWFLDCGHLEHGFARVRCRPCRAEFLVVFRCKGRHFCPSCHARRLAEWSLWLDEHLLAPVPHRQVVLTVPKRLRAYFLHDRRRLGSLGQGPTARCVATSRPPAASATPCSARSSASRPSARSPTCTPTSMCS